MRRFPMHLAGAALCTLLALTGCSKPADTSHHRPANVPAAASWLPAEAQQTLRLIDQGGPFPHDRDGITFGNFEKRLPNHPRGYYHEYTVRTPGEHSRGARRIITGGNPPEVYYYTEDHYRSFREITAADRSGR